MFPSSREPVALCVCSPNPAFESVSISMVWVVSPIWIDRGVGEDVRSEREETIAGGLSGVVNAVGDIIPMSGKLIGRALSSEIVEGRVVPKADGWVLIGPGASEVLWSSGRGLRRDSL